MKLIDLVKLRQSVRKYSDKTVEREKIELCIEAARYAPSACNSQPWKFIIVDDPELRQKVAGEAYSAVLNINKFALQSPVMIALVMEKAATLSQVGGRIKNKEFSLIDIGIAAEHFCLQAAESGLGTCMIGWFNENKVKKILGIPPRKTVALLFTIGYSAEEKIREKKRKSTEEIRTYNKY